ncbi:Fic family protein [archaeon]|nr:Fic family protein [archaeon]
MVYLAESKRGAKIYYYLVQDIRLSKGKRKQLRKYIGTKKPSEIKLQVLMAEFEKGVEKEKLKLHGFHYLTKEEIAEIDIINKDFSKRYVKHNVTVRDQFDQNFVMAFVFNTNSIEGSTLTPKEVELLLAENISPNKPLDDVLEAKAAEKTINFAKEHNGNLDADLLFKFHEMYFKETKPGIAGKYKKIQNYIKGSRFETTPPELVITDMKLYFKEYKELKKKFHPLELAAWVHWKLVRIHPFQDGNGRTARIVMNFVLHQNGYGLIDIKTKDKKQYMKHLENCNYHNNAGKLAELLVKRFKSQYKNALK